MKFALIPIPIFCLVVTALGQNLTAPASLPTSMPVDHAGLIDQIVVNDISLKDLLDMLAKTERTTFLITGDKEAASKITIHSLAVHDVRLWQVLKVIEAVVPGVTPAVIDGDYPIYNIYIDPDAISGEPGKIMAAFPLPIDNRFADADIENLDANNAARIQHDEWLNKQLRDEMSVIEQAMDMVGGSPPTLKIHLQTKILLFKGTVQQQGMLMRVVDALERSKRSATTQPTPTPQQLKNSANLSALQQSMKDFAERSLHPEMPSATTKP